MTNQYLIANSKREFTKRRLVLEMMIANYTGDDFRRERVRRELVRTSREASGK